MNKLTIDIIKKTIKYDDIVYKLSSEQLNKFINSNINFKLYDCNDSYVSYISSNKRKVFLIEYFYDLKYDHHDFVFKNDDKYDLRPENVKIYHKYHNNIKYEYQNIQFFEGHYKKNGYDAYIMKNPYWKICEEGEEYYLMQCEPNNTLIKLNDNSLDKILNYEKDENNETKLTFFVNENEIKAKKYNNVIINLTSIISNYYNKFNLDYRCDKDDNYTIYNKDNYKHPYHYEIIKKYPNAIYYAGHAPKRKCLINMKNPYWKIIDENNEEYYLMYCESNTIFKIDDKSLNIIREFEKNYNNNERLTFYKHQNGYIVGHLNNLYLHQIIMNFYGQGKGTSTFSIDHINRNQLDNRYSNLRIATLQEQQNNSKGILEGTKRNRKHNAQELPNDIKHSDLPKYVYYCKEKYNSNGDIRDFFRIEKHPNQNKPISTSKSMKISILDKLKEAKNIIQKLDNQIQEETQEIQETQEETSFTLPTGFYITKFRNSDHLIYDYKNIDTKERKNMRMKLPDNYNLEKVYNNFLTKLYEKYPELNLNQTEQPDKITQTDESNELNQLSQQGQQGQPSQPSQTNKPDETKEQFILPKSFYITKTCGKTKLVYAINNTSYRREMRMVIPDNYNLKEEYNKLIERIHNKWDEDEFNSSLQPFRKQLDKNTDGKFSLPTNFNIRNIKDKIYLVYAENKLNCKRQLSMILPKDYNMEEEYQNILQRIKDKYKNN